MTFSCQKTAQTNPFTLLKEAESKTKPTDREILLHRLEAMRDAIPSSRSLMKEAVGKMRNERSQVITSDVRAGWNAVNGEWARLYFKTKGKYIDPNTRTRSRSAKSASIIKNL